MVRAIYVKSAKGRKGTHETEYYPVDRKEPDTEGKDFSRKKRGFHIEIIKPGSNQNSD
jgi:hypothetical protein